MQVKTCRECGAELPLSEFYAHPKMADGHLNKCKTCVRNRVRKHAEENAERINAYNRSRASLPLRRMARDAYQKTERGIESGRKAKAAWALKNPERRVAHHAVNNAVRDGKIMRMACEVCGDDKTQAHHVAYDRPMLVVWMCAAHHAQTHKEHREYIMHCVEV